MSNKNWMQVAVVVVLLCIGVYAVTAQAPQDPNSISDPNTIKLPEKAKMPIRLKCPVHGIIGKAYIIIETDSGAKVYCGKCAKTFVAEVFDLNLPKLEVVK